MDTIFALASGSYHAGIAVVRVSGQYALQTLKTLGNKAQVTPRQMVRTILRDPKTNLPLDDCLAVYFQNPHSFTGEDVIEYHVHGGRAVIDGVLNALSNMDGCRMAEPGEFTKRAFENGKLDLTEAEAIADLIAAETEMQRSQALVQLGGGLSKIYQGWTDRLTKILAHQEADIEFPDEDLPDGISNALVSQVQDLITEIKTHLDDNNRGEALRTGIKVAIIGAPNAGKSSLLNALAARDVAIVSDEAGTTRDVIDVHLNLSGYPIVVSDTAGLRATDQKIEAEGIKRAKKTAHDAHIKMALFDGTQPAQDIETLNMIDDNTMVVFNKSDVAKQSLSACRHDGVKQFSVSAKTGDGIDVLLKSLSERISVLFKENTDKPALTRTRHRQALQDAVTHLEKSLAVDLPELSAEDMRMALRHIGRITGRVHVEEILDKIFRDFCIGK